jgi:hypothetical protein
MAAAASTTWFFRRSAIKSARFVWLRIHLWLGLALGLFLSQIGKPGAAPVHFLEIEVYDTRGVSSVIVCPIGRVSFDRRLLVAREAAAELRWSERRRRGKSKWQIEAPAARVIDAPGRMS